MNFCVLFKQRIGLCTEGGPNIFFDRDVVGGRKAIGRIGLLVGVDLLDQRLVELLDRIHLYIIYLVSTQ